MDAFNRTLARLEPHVLSIYRIVAGLLLLQYGVAKLLKFPAGTVFEKVEPTSLFGVAGMFELVLGALLVLGLFTRPVAFILCGEMAFAYFIGHVPKSFIPLLSGGNLAIMFCFSCLYFIFAGGGMWSLDAMMRKK
jgi:putative oxidoreductase